MDGWHFCIISQCPSSVAIHCLDQFQPNFTWLVNVIFLYIYQTFIMSCCIIFCDVLSSTITEGLVIDRKMLYLKLPKGNKCPWGYNIYAYTCQKRLMFNSLEIFFFIIFVNINSCDIQTNMAHFLLRQTRYMYIIFLWSYFSKCHQVLAF